MLDRFEHESPVSSRTGAVACGVENALLEEQLTRNSTHDSDSPARDLGSRFAPELAQLTVVILWSSTFVVTKAAFAEVSPLGVIFSRFLIMVALALAVLFIKERGANLWIDRADAGRFVLAGLTGYTLYQLGFILGLSRTSPFSSSLLIAMVPLFTVVILALMGERTPLQGWVGLAVALVGVVIFLLDKRDSSTGTLIGDLLSIGAGISFAIYGIVNRPLVIKYPTATYTAWSVLAGAIPLFLIALPAALQQDWGAVSGAAWFSIVYLAILPVYVAYMLWNYAIARRGVATASSFGLLVPIVAGILSAVFMGEPFGPAKLLGAALVMAGLVIVRLPRLANRMWSLQMDRVERGESVNESDHGRAPARRR